MLRTKNHGRRTADGTRRTDIWITKSLPELSSGETKTTYPPSGVPSASSCRGKLSLRCWASAWLNDCANGDEADLTFIQTQKRKVSNIIQKPYILATLQTKITRRKLNSGKANWTKGLWFWFFFFFFFLINLSPSSTLLFLILPTATNEVKGGTVWVSFLTTV